MWTLVVGGVFGLVTLVVKAVLDAGSRDSRARAVLMSEIELLKSLPAGIDGEEDLRRRVEVRLKEYARRADEEPSPEAVELDEFARMQQRRINIGRAIEFAGYAGMLTAAATAVVNAGRKDDFSAGVVAYVAIAIVVTVLGVYSSAQFRKAWMERTTERLTRRPPSAFPE